MRYFICSFWMLLSALISEGQSKGSIGSQYNDFTDREHENIFSESFSTNDYGWEVGVFEQCRMHIWQPGFYQLKSTCSGHSAGVTLNADQTFIDQKRNFEIEFTAMQIHGDQNDAIGLSWGQANQQKYFFAFSEKGEFVIAHNSKRKWEYWVPWSRFEGIRRNTYNKLTIRKVDRNYYFFINEMLVHTHAFTPFFGEQLSFQSMQNAAIGVDQIDISYLIRDPSADHLAPKLELNEPDVTHGSTYETTSKSILIEGSARDESGLFEVTVNNISANLDAEGRFSYQLRLAVGINQVDIRAEDINGNASTYQFEVIRSGTAANETESTIQSIPSRHENRLALVIGNSNYEGGQFLKNPVNDANIMASTLENLGFDVIKELNADRTSMTQAIVNFSRKLSQHNVALFYYAGHGIQVDGENYLLPIDAKLEAKEDCKYEAVSVSSIIGEFEQYPDNINVVILDACRNDPFKSWSRGGNRGFKAIPPSSGTIIAFATSEGATASDGTGENGLFTEQLIKQMYVPQPIEGVFKQTRVHVEKLSNGAQSPQEWSKLKGDFFFAR